MSASPKKKPAPAQPLNEEALVDRLHNELVGIELRLEEANRSVQVAALNVELGAEGAEAELEQASTHRDSLAVRQDVLQNALKAASARLTARTTAEKAKADAAAEARAKVNVAKVKELAGVFDEHMAKAAAAAKEAAALRVQIHVDAPHLDDSYLSAFRCFPNVLTARFYGVSDAMKFTVPFWGIDRHSWAAEMPAWYGRSIGQQ